ncbi:hypothetical protein B0H10DRAFT_2209524 [Mycena sp. CBHHK59/15]|nr:hypothetical protein B0H10DRAFT_2209524 [Mycena sp. CBHHK59/15]
MGLSAEQYDSLKTASKCFLSERDFSFDEIEAAMAAVFGVDRWKRAKMTRTPPHLHLFAAKLKERSAPDQGKPQPEVPEAPKKPAGQSSSKWTATDTEWDAAAW